MRPETIEKLRAVNQAFYRGSAAAFSDTRSRPWAGWEALLDRFERPISVLDLGCGNGRFLDALIARNLAADYLGVDTSAPLLDIARRRHPKARFLQADATNLSPPQNFDLAVAFGLLHHLPGHTERRRFFEHLPRLATRAAVTFWRFADKPRFSRLMRPWSEIDLSPKDVEPGDHLLSFEGEGLRYCHHAGDAEIDALVAASGMREATRWYADGASSDLNLYVLLERIEGHST